MLAFGLAICNFSNKRRIEPFKRSTFPWQRLILGKPCRILTLCAFRYAKVFECFCSKAPSTWSFWGNPHCTRLKWFKPFKTSSSVEVFVAIPTAYLVWLSTIKNRYFSGPPKFNGPTKSASTTWLGCKAIRSPCFSGLVLGWFARVHVGHELTYCPTCRLIWNVQNFPARYWNNFLAPWWATIPPISWASLIRFFRATSLTTIRGITSPSALVHPLHNTSSFTTKRLLCVQKALSCGGKAKASNLDGVGRFVWTIVFISATIPSFCQVLTFFCCIGSILGISTVFITSSVISSSTRSLLPASMSSSSILTTATLA